MEKQTISVQELSLQLGISLPKAYELVKTPGFPVIRIGTRILVPVDSVFSKKDYTDIAIFVEGLIVQLTKMFPSMH